VRLRAGPIYKIDKLDEKYKMVRANDSDYHLENTIGGFIMLLLAFKTSQVALHMSVAFAVTYAFTGSLATGGVAAVVEPICNVTLMPLHDKLWTRLKDRRMRRNEGRTSAPAALGTCS